MASSQKSEYPSRPGTSPRKATGEPAEICLVTEDAALARLISLESGELSLAFSVCTSADGKPDAEVPEVLWLLDQDSAAGRAAASKLPRSAARILIGRGISDSADGHRLHRPFETARLRQLLLSLAAGARTIERTTSREGAAADLLLAMEDETTLRCGTRRITLTTNEAAVMRCLIAHRGELVTHEMLEQCLGGTSRSNKIEVYLCFLRRKLEVPVVARLITTVRGKGYRLEH